MHNDALRPAENPARGVHVGTNAAADSGVLELYLADPRQLFNSILGEARLYDRLAVMPVSLLGADAPGGHAA